MGRALLSAIVVLLSLGLGLARIEASPYVLRYDEPAPANARPLSSFVPIGNGRLGALLNGGTEKDRLVLSEGTLWTGDGGSGDAPNGAFQYLGEAVFSFPGHEAAAGYKAGLDLGDGMYRVEYTGPNGVRFTREYLASYPANAIAVHYAADKGGNLTGMLSLADSHQGAVSAEGNRITVSGTLANGLHYEWQALVAKEGKNGTVTARADGALEVKGCDAVTLLIAAGTDYALDFLPTPTYRTTPPHDRVKGQLDKIAGRSWNDLRNQHWNDYRPFFDRVVLDVGTSAPGQEALPFPKRLAAAKTFDPGLDELLFQYGRYLLIASSRPGADSTSTQNLPPNLQGLWNDTNTPPQGAAYAAKLPFMMSAWPAEVANLDECLGPFIDLIRSQLVPWRKATAEAFPPQPGPDGKAPDQPPQGFLARSFQNPSGGQWGRWNPAASIWYARPFYDRYAFTRDTDYLRAVGYPVLKECVGFWDARLKAQPDGKLVVPDSWLAPDGAAQDGGAEAQEALWDLYANYLDAARVLNADGAYQKTIAERQKKILLPGKEEGDGPETFRAASLFGLYPGRRIDGSGPDAAKRTDAGNAPIPWAEAVAARLGNDPAPNGFAALGNRSPNGVDAALGVPGNLGLTAAMAETLIQSHGREIVLLPALPGAWKDGSVTGLRARGGFTVDIAWKDGKLVSAAVRNAGPRPCSLRYGKTTATFFVQPYGGVEFGPGLEPKK
ncbi:MAG TPA: glycoside hydrolase N-terminal domain-containing protein [Candidatus Methylacidiphilales bacterium]